jgi:NADH-quinone oxidoreductase subunit E
VIQQAEINKIELPENILQEMAHWVAKYPTTQKQSAILPILLLLQEHNQGWLSKSYLDYAADYLEMPKIAVYEVATFYSMYDLEPKGRHKINVCTNISCLLADSDGDGIMHCLEKKLKIKAGETTPDGLFSLKEVECLGACVGAPMMQIDNEYYENLTEEKIEKILKNYQREDV